MDRRLTREQAANLHGQPVYDTDLDKIGEVNRVLYDASTGQPEWLGLSTGFLAGLLGTKTVLVPVATASIESDGIRVPYTKDQVKDAPAVTIERDAISEADERALYDHYGLDYSRSRSASQLPESATPRATAAGDQPRETARERWEDRGRDATERTRPADTGGRLELREEELRAQRRSVETGEVQVRKEVVEEGRTLEVPVTREEVYIERRPVEGRQVSDRPIDEGETLRIPVREEEVTVEKQPVVREEIEIGKRQVQDTEQVSGTVRREEARIEREGDVDVRDSGRQTRAVDHEHRWVDNRCADCGETRA
jgi:uncharacterized protein (TIGR02271 family)